MPNKLLASLYQYPEKDQRRFMGAFESLSFSIADKAAALIEIEEWLNVGVLAPTAIESADGWHKKFFLFGVEGDGGEVCIRRVVSMEGLHKWKGLDLDTWKPSKPSKKRRKLPEQGSASRVERMNRMGFHLRSGLKLTYPTASFHYQTLSLELPDRSATHFLLRPESGGGRPS